MAGSHGKWMLVAGALACAFLMGAVGIVVAGRDLGRVLDGMFGLSFSFFAFQWYCIDSNEKGYARTITRNWAILALGLVSLPHYFFRTRGAGRAIGATAVLYGLLAAYLASLMAGATIAVVIGGAPE